MSEDAAFANASLPLTVLRRIDDASSRFEAAWHAGDTPRIEDYLEGFQEPERTALFRELLRSELELRKGQEATLHEAAYHARFPHGGDVIRSVFRDPASLGLSPGPLSETPPGLGDRVRLTARAAGYDILQELGRGGMAVVYLARQSLLKRLVALKVIQAWAHADANLRARFRAEATSVARLQHPNIVQIYEVAEHANELFLVLEYVEGGTLAAKLADRPQPPQEAARLLEVLARAVHAAHQKGIVHRDLKPTNVLLTADGQPKIADFGLAKNLAPEPGESAPGNQTQSGAIVGTPAYMAPEQARGDVRSVGPATDVYALGAILYEMLAGQPPFRAATVLDLLTQVCDQDPVSLRSARPGVPRDLETICLTCLRKEPANRYVSAEALADDLRRFLNGESVLVRPPSALEQLHKLARRHKALAGGLAAVVVVSVVGALVSVFYAVRAERSAAVAIEQKRLADFQTYRARLAAASAALAGHDVTDAARQLRAAPQELRDWEWRHLHSRLDDSAAVRTVPAGSFPLLFRGPKGFRFGAGDGTGSDLRLTDEDGRDCFVKRLAPPHRFHWVGETPAGLWMLEGDDRNHFRLLDEAGNVLVQLDGAPNGASRTMAVSPDQTRLAIVWAVGPNAHECHLIETASGKKLALLANRPEAPLSLAFSPDGRQIVASFEDGTARVWDGFGVPITELGGPAGHSFKVISAAFRPDGSRVVTTSADGTVRQWDPRTGRQVEPPYEWHVGEVVVAAYSPDGQWVASGGTDRTVRVWRATGRQDVAVLHGHTGSVTDLLFSADGRRLASASRDRGLGYAHDDTQRLWEVDPRAGLPVLRGHGSYVYPVAYSPDGQWVASGSWDKTVRLWDARTGESVAELPHPAVVWALAFGPDGAWLATSCHGDDRLRIWDVATARLRKEVPAPGGSTRFLAVRPDGARIAATAFDGAKRSLNVFDPATGANVFAGEAIAIAYSPDGKRLAGCTADGKTLLVWDAETHQPSARFATPEGAISSAAFSPDGRRIATCGTDRVVRVWEIATGNCRELSGHTDEVFAVAFHPGGTRLASAGRDRAVWLWDLAAGEEVARLQGHATYVWALAFSPDGATLASGSGDGTVRLWDTEPLAERHRARREAEALRPEADRLVERLFGEGKEPAGVVAALRADSSLGEPLRHAALRAVLRRATAAAAGNAPVK